MQFSVYRSVPKMHFIQETIKFYDTVRYTQSEKLALQTPNVLIKDRSHFGGRGFFVAFLLRRYNKRLEFVQIRALIRGFKMENTICPSGYCAEQK
jgi:hypothetical protein